MLVFERYGWGEHRQSLSSGRGSGQEGAADFIEADATVQVSVYWMCERAASCGSSVPNNSGGGWITVQGCAKHASKEGAKLTGINVLQR